MENKVQLMLFSLLIELAQTLKGVMAVSGNSLTECMNTHGISIESGRMYVPGPDLCKMCFCDNGHPKNCKALLCTPPHECKSFQIGSACCDFVCLDDTLGNNNNGKTSDYVTLALSLLIFILNRFRQRKIRMRVNRQVNDEQRNMGSIGYIGGNINYMGGGTMNMEYPFENHPGHYHFWKPPSEYCPRGEAPPPYEEAVALAQAESLHSQC
ncbi:hypothetical protein Bhyg_13713, partial [Pseudolycoriella hygida]